MALDLRTKCRLIEIHQRHCVVSFDKTLYPLLRTFSTKEDRNCPDMTEQLLTGSKRININKILNRTEIK